MNSDRFNWNLRATSNDQELMVEQAWQSVSTEQLEALHRLLDAPPVPNERLRRTMAAART